VTSSSSDDPITRVVSASKNRRGHDDLAGRADFGHAAIAKGLRADVGQADGIGVVAMVVEGSALGGKRR
jgi:hypothetical protein